MKRFKEFLSVGCQLAAIVAVLTGELPLASVLLGWAILVEVNK